MEPGPRCAGSGASGLEDGVERGCEVRPVVAEQELDVLEFLAEAYGEVAGWPYRPFAGGMFGDAAEVHRRVPCSVNTSTYSRLSRTVLACRRSTARIPAAWA